MKTQVKLSLHVWGEDACFSRPEMKVERVSYDVITPSAARGIFEAILWKPGLQWTVQQIDVLKPIRWQSLRRNEVGSKIPAQNVATAMKKGVGNLALYIEDDRQQRAGLFLRDVAYVLHASLSLTERAGPADNLTKFAAMFKRRLESGQCHHMPVFGCREFPAYFASPSGTEAPIAESRDLGWMLHDLDFTTGASPEPRFFRAEMQAGIIEVPEFRAGEGRA